ncbi:MAG: hypothetical protein ACKO96_10695, partial [Flammeovirgaceae bacterium]
FVLENPTAQYFYPRDNLPRLKDLVLFAIAIIAETFNRVITIAIVSFETASRDSIVPYIDSNV